MASTDLKLEDCGSLPKPGPIGRLVRLGFAYLCLYYVSSLWAVRGDLLTETDHVRPLIWNGLLIGLFLVNYVINIGFSRDWKKRPAVVSALLFFSVGVFGYLQSGSFETEHLAQVIYYWEIYVFVHLGLAFLIAAIIATPGCEMRALHHLFSRVTGVQTQQHVCPIGPLGAIDRWENMRKRS